jgi:lipocalin
MLRKSTLLAILLFHAFVGTISAQEYKPIDALDVDAYMGRWYQTHANLQFILIELGGRCATADYKLEADGKISLVNQARPWFVPQLFARTTGFVVQGDESPGAFTVVQRYLRKTNPDEVEYKTPGNYWIIGIGPIVNGQYQWAAVSDPEKSLSFIIARDVKDFRDKYEDDALKVFDDFGFDKVLDKKPLRTSHHLCFGYRTRFT